MTRSILILELCTNARSIAVSRRLLTDAFVCRENGHLEHSHDYVTSDQMTHTTTLIVLVVICFLFKYIYIYIYMVYSSLLLTSLTKFKPQRFHLYSIPLADTDFFNNITR